MQLRAIIALIKNANADNILLRFILLIVIFGLISACARPTGDFGRVQPNFIHDDILPEVGKLRARADGEPVSNLNLTDEESEMHDRVWRFLVAPHAKDWFYDIAVEWQRTRLIAAVDNKFSIERYYDYLRTERYSSSRVRYFKLANDIDADLNTAPGVFKAICAALEIDRRRAIAVNSLNSAGVLERNSVNQRKAENALFMDWFVRAIRFRYDSYSLALARLLIETPHEGARDIDRKLSSFAIELERAERRDFCGSSLVYSKKYDANIIPSRYGVKAYIFGSTSDPEPEYLK